MYPVLPVHAKYICNLFPIYFLLVPNSLPLPFLLLPLPFDPSSLPPSLSLYPIPVLQGEVQCFQTVQANQCYQHHSHYGPSG